MNPIVNLEELEFHEWERETVDASGEPIRLAGRLGPIGTRIGTRQIGANITIVPPGARAFPFHSHGTNEEFFLVLAGEGEVRIGEHRFAVREGDAISCPAGGPETAHQLSNNSTSGDLKYLAISTMQPFELTEYPDSGEFAIAVPTGPGPGGTDRTFSFLGTAGDAQRPASETGCCLGGADAGPD